MAKRPFRTSESLAAEAATQELLPEFLTHCGMVIEDNRFERNGQTIVAVLSGRRLTMRVKLCWHRFPDHPKIERHRTYSAAQLMAHVSDANHESSVANKVQNLGSLGVTHYLFVQSEGSRIVNAAIAPLSAILPIWIKQRDISAKLIQQGRLGRRRKNHATNGSSPTIWLQDDKAPEIADAFWTYKDVQGLLNFEPFDSLPNEIPHGQKYFEGCAERITVNRYERDSRARRECIRNYGTTCIVCGLELGAVYGPNAAGLIHVHHLQPLSQLGPGYEVDPIRDLAPVCPNCHAVIHRREPPFSLEEVRSFLHEAANKSSAN